MKLEERQPRGGGRGGWVRLEAAVRGTLRGRGWTGGGGGRRWNTNMRIKAVEGIKAYNRGSDLWSCVRPSIRPSVGLPPRISSVYPSVFLSGNLSFSLSRHRGYRLSHFPSPSSVRGRASLQKFIRRRKLHLSLFEWNARRKLKRLPNGRISNRVIASYRESRVSFPRLK